VTVAQRYVAQQQTGRGGPSGLADVLEVLLDKGLVIDAFVRVSLVGIELLTIDARVVVASVDTYLRFAEAVNRLDLLQASNSQTVGDVMEGGVERGARSKVKGAVEGVREGLGVGSSSQRAEQRS
jgi:gas vesicle structural protein